MAAPSQALVTSVTITPGIVRSVCSDDHLSPGRPAEQQAASSHQERALRYFSMTQSKEPGNSEGEPNVSPLPPTSSAGLRQQEESKREHPEKKQEKEEEGVRGRQQGGASEENQESSCKGKPCFPDIQQHPQHWWRRDESKPLCSWSGGDEDSQKRGEKGGRGLQPLEASSKQEQERSYGQTCISGTRMCLKKQLDICRKEGSPCPPCPPCPSSSILHRLSQWGTNV